MFTRGGAGAESDPSGSGVLTKAWLAVVIAVQALGASVGLAASVGAGVPTAEPGPSTTAGIRDSRSVARDERIRARAMTALGRQAPSFEANRGQHDPSVRFHAQGRHYGLFLTDREAVLVLAARDPISPPRRSLARRRAVPGPSRPTPVRISVVRLRLAGADPSAAATGLEALPGKINYLVGSDPARWRTDVPRYARVAYRDVYPGIDLVYYSAAAGELEYDFVVAPGADPDRIAMIVDSDQPIAISASGDALISTAAGELRLRTPLVYQEIDGLRRVIPSRYVLSEEGPTRTGRTLRFHLAEYDRRRALVIDPVLVYSTYLGGTSGDQGEGVAVDKDGDAYVTGGTASIDFPTLNSLPGLISARENAFVSKFDAAGTLVYSTYLGADAGSRTFGAGIAVDTSGHAYVTGGASAFEGGQAVPLTGFPTTPGAYRTEPIPSPINSPYFSGDTFVAKLSPAGSQLVYSTFLGASAGEIPGPLMGIAVDAAGQAYVAGVTDTAAFPTKNAVQSTYGGGGADAFVVKLNAQGSGVTYSTFLGGSGEFGEYPARVAVDSRENAYVVGGTDSPDFKIQDALQPKMLGEAAAFITKLDPQGALVYSTFLGGSCAELGFDGAVDAVGSVYVVGVTCSDDFPLVNPLQNRGDALRNGNDERELSFVAKLDPQGASLVYSTYFGTTSAAGCVTTLCEDQLTGVAVDADGNAYLTGQTSSVDFPVTGNAIQTRAGTGSGATGRANPLEAVLSQLDPSGTVLRYSTYLGGRGNDFGQDVAIDGSGRLYVTGTTESSEFPIFRARQPQLPGSRAAFVLHLDFPLEERSPLEFVTFPDVLPSLPPVAVVGQPYVGNVGLGGGRPPYAVTVIRGALPKGLRLGTGEASPAPELRTSTTADGCLPPGGVGSLTNLITGTPEVAGTFCPQACGSDSAQQSVVKRFQITVLPPGATGGADTGPRSLLVAWAGTGQGVVEVLTPGAVAPEPVCNGCTRQYASCADVLLTAQPAAGSSFSGWLGGGCEGSGTGGQCDLIMNEDVTVTVRFDAHPRVTVRREGNGSGRVVSVPAGIDCGAQCEAAFEPTTLVRLTATPENGAMFAGWSGVACPSATCEITLHESMTVQARFETVGTQTPLALVASVLPASRSVAVGSPATVSATVIATGAGQATGCGVGLDGGPPVSLTYQPYDPSTGQPTGPVNVPVTLTAGAPQALLLAVTPLGPFPATDLPLRFACANATPAVPIPGVNTLLLSSAVIAPPDVVVLAATPSGDGIVRVPASGAAAFAVASVNVGTGARIAFAADGGDVGLPIALAVCETTASGQCVAPPGPGATRRIEPGETPTYTVFVIATGPIGADPARHRIYVRFRDEAGAIRGAASVAVEAAAVSAAASAPRQP